MTRRKVEQMRDALVERDPSQGEVTRAAAEIIEQLAGMDTLAEEIREALAGDLGDVAVESLRVTK